MKVWVTPPGMEPRLSEELAEGKEKWAEEDSSFTHQLWPDTEIMQ